MLSEAHFNGDVRLKQKKQVKNSCMMVLVIKQLVLVAGYYSCSTIN
jgi:hypothetical protein